MNCPECNKPVIINSLDGSGHCQHCGSAFREDMDADEFPQIPDYEQFERNQIDLDEESYGEE